jgi:molybdate transport system substrate-binding protein
VAPASLYSAEYNDPQQETLLLPILRTLLLACLPGLVTLVAGPTAGAEAADGRVVTVFAAASLRNALDAAAAAFSGESGSGVVISYAGSPMLAKQIESGAPADIFISADLAWMDHVEAAGLVKPGTRFNLLGNRLVLVAPADSKVELAIAPGFGLRAALGDSRLAMADVAAVPAGKYAKAALESLGIWAEVEGAVAGTENVRAALALVATGESAFGIVYRSDAAAEPGVRVVGTFPEDSHPPIIYPAAELAGSGAPATAALMDFLKSAAARAIFERQGFDFLAP